MGKCRNEDGEKNKGRHFSDDDVDKFYLAGFSPFEEFRNTKSSSWLGDCYRAAFPKRAPASAMDWDQWSRNDDLVAQFQALPQEEREKYGYEHDLMCLLEALVDRCDHRIRVVQEELKAQNAKINSSMNRSEEQELDKVNKELEELTQKVSDVGKKAEREVAGSHDELQSLMKQQDAK